MVSKSVNINLTKPVRSSQPLNNVGNINVMSVLRVEMLQPETIEMHEFSFAGQFSNLPFVTTTFECDQANLNNCNFETYICNLSTSNCQIIIRNLNPLLALSGFLHVFLQQISLPETLVYQSKPQSICAK